MTNHTPGPWKVSRRFDIYQDTQTPGVGGTFVASTKGISELPESVNQVCEADAKLISLAPKMLDAIEGAMKIVDLWQPSEDTPEERWEEAQAVYMMKSVFEDILRKVSE